MHSRAEMETLERRRLMAVLLPGFVETPVTGHVDRGTTLEIAPDGKLFVVEQRGTIQVYSSYAAPNELLQPNYFRDEQPPITSSGEAGMLGLAFDPNYESNRYVYVNYTRSGTGNRVSRFTANAAGDLALPGSEVVLIETGGGSAHFGGALHVGPDGKLYVGSGDRGFSNNAQSITSLGGKILRINRTPGDVIPNDNPASIAGIAGTTSGVHRAIWAAGLRNPYTLAFQPGTGRMFINDVGLSWEEINEGGAGRNFGWRTTEGDFDPAQYPHFTRPLLAYPNPAMGSGVIGAAFYHPGISMFPPDYAGDYFFGDLSGWLKRMDPGTLQVQDFASNIGLTDLRVAPDGSLLYVGYQFVNGRVYRITHDDVAPTVTAAAFEFDGVTLPNRPHRLRFAFSENVAASLATDDLALVNLTTGQTVAPASIAVSYDAPTNTATFTFPGSTNAILPDGRYSATLRAAGVIDAAQNPLPADHVIDFFFLSGDANHDGRVGLADFNRLGVNFGQSPRIFSQGDFNYDGVVNLRDFNVLAGRFGAALAPVPVSSLAANDDADGLID